MTDELLYDKAHFLAVHDFIASNFKLATKELLAKSPIDTIRSRTGNSLSLLLLNKAILQLLPCLVDYRTELRGLREWPSYFELVHDKATFYISNSSISLERPLSDTLFLDLASCSWYARTQNYSSGQIADELIQQFPIQDFSFLNLR